MRLWHRRIKGIAVIHEGDVVMVETDHNISRDEADAIKGAFERHGVGALVLSGVKFIGVKRAMP